LLGEANFFGSLTLKEEVKLYKHLYLMGANATSAISNTSQIVFGTPTDIQVAISSNTDALVINKDTTTLSP
jgi:hypothetical protein